MSVVPNSCLTILEDDIISETDQVVESYTRFSKFVKEYGNDPNVSTKLRHKLSEIAERIRSRRKEAFSGDIFNKNEYETILAHLNGNKSSVISHVLVNILYKKEMFQLLKSTCETVIISCISLLNQLEFICGRNQNQPNQSQLLFAELRKIGCKFLKPTLHEDFLKLTIRLFENITSSKDTLSKHTIVEYLSLKLKNDFPNIQKDDLEMAINLLIRADCLQIKNFYLSHYEIGLNKKCFKYDALRRQHDAFMIAMAQECDIEMNPVKWSQTLYGNDSKTSEMQSIIAHLRSQETFTKLIAKFYKRIEKLNLQIILSQPILNVRCDFEKIDEIYCLKKQHPKSFDPVSSDNDPNLMATTQNDIYIMWSDLAESFDLTRNILKANMQFFNNMIKLINQQNVYQSNQISKLLY